MRAYAPGLDDVTLAHWWDHLATTGDLLTLFPPKVHGLAAFLARFQAPTLLLGAVDDQGISAAVWGTPWHSGAEVGLWVRAGRRRTRAALADVEAGIGTLLARWPVLVALTHDQSRRDLYAHFGVVMSEAPIPSLLEGHGAYVGWLTADTFTRRVQPAVAAAVVAA